jgi:integrase
MRTFDDDQLGRFLGWKPKTNGDQRFYAMFCTVADTGIRAKECLTIKMEDIDFDLSTGQNRINVMVR